MFNKSAIAAIINEDTEFFDATFRISDTLKSETHGDEGYNLLHYAARHSTEKMVKYFLDNGFSLTSRTSYNQTPLHVAVIYCRVGVVKFLTEQGCSVNARDSLGRTPLLCAMEMGKIRHLSSKPTGTTKRTTPPRAARAPSTPMVDWATTYDTHSVSRLVKNFYETGAKVLIDQEDTPFCTAKRSQGHAWYTNIVSLEEDIVDDCCIEERGEHYFLSTENREIIDHLLKSGADVNALTHLNDTPLFKAIARGSESLVRLFLERGADVKYCKRGYTALHYAALTRYKNIVEVLIDAGVDVNASTSSQGRTALHLAASSANNEEIVNLLIERGATVDAKDNKGETPMLRAIGSTLKYAYRNNVVNAINTGNVLIDTVQIEAAYRQVEAKVIECKVIKRASDARYSEPEVLERRKRIINSLLNAGADVNQINEKEPALHRAITTNIEDFIKLFLDRGADVRCKGEFCWSSLHAAVKFASAKVVETLIDRGAEIEAKGLDWVTPLHIAVEFLREQQAKVLVAKGANVNAKDLKGCTPLHYVAFAVASMPDSDVSVKNILMILLENGANPCIKAADNNTPLDYATTMDHDEFIEILLRHLAYLESIGDTSARRVAMRTIDSDTRWKMVYMVAQREMVNMKEHIVFGDLSYFDLITFDPTILVRNKEFVKAFKTNFLITQFYFYEKVSRKFKAALNKKDATEYLAEMFSFARITIPICEMIVEYLKPKEIEIIVRGCEKEGS